MSKETKETRKCTCLCPACVERGVHLGTECESPVCRRGNDVMLWGGL